MAPTASVWRIVFGTFVAGGIWLTVVAAALAVSTATEAAPRIGVLGFLLSFSALIAGFGLATRRLHGLPGVQLLGAERRIEWPALLRGAALVAAIAGLSVAPMLLLEPPARQHELWRWALWLPAVVPALFLQVAGEEIAFRGYLQGMLAARFQSRLVWWLLPAVAFGSLHWNPAEFGPNAPLVVAAATLMGLVFGDVTARSGSLALAIGLHFANNAFAMLVVATPSALSGFALYLSPVDTGDPATVRAGIIANMGLIAAVWLIYILLQRRRLRRAQGR
jgi:uncharacterized protein